LPGSKQKPFCSGKLQRLVSYQPHIFISCNLPLIGHMG
jgi:hypothetical protein